LGFVAGLAFTYYVYVVERKFDTFIWNPAIYNNGKIPYGWKTGWFMILSNPIITFVMGVMGFFLAQTGQLQFILPQMFGAMMVLYPNFIWHLQTLNFVD
jgi:hypothetical protein